MKPSEEIEKMVRLYRIRYPEDYDAPKGWIIATMAYLDEQYAITNSTTTMKKTKKVNKLKVAKTAKAKKLVKGKKK